MKWYKVPVIRWRNNPKSKSLKEVDFQRRRVYGSEGKVLRWGRMSNRIHKFETIDEIQKFVDDFCSKRWFIDRWGTHKIKVENGSGRICARGGNDKIHMPRWARDELQVLHEVAHCLPIHWTLSGHGRWWARTYLELIRFVIGGVIFEAMRDSFKEHGVKYLPRRILSESHRLSAIENIKRYQKVKDFGKGER